MSWHSELAAESRQRQAAYRQQTQQERATSLVLELERVMLSLDTNGREMVRQDVTEMLARFDSAAWSAMAARLEANCGR